MNAQQPNARLTIVFFFFLALYGLLIVNLYVLQILQSTFFKERGQKQYCMAITVTPPRAEIFDRTGRHLLALNKEAYAAFIIPNCLNQKKQVVPFLKKYFTEAAARLAKNPSSHFMYIKRRLTKKELELIESSDLDDIKLLKEPSRYYPVPGIGPLVGITDIDNQGLFGIEKIFNHTLAGVPSEYILEKDCRKNRLYISRETKVAGSGSSPLTLTIDSVLQFLVYEELKDYMAKMGAKSGSTLICDPTSGEILVMANYPDFDPNKTEQLPMELTKNRIITDAYEFGSIIKVFLALAGLEEGVVTEKSLIDCENRLKTRINGVPISTTHANGMIPFEDVIRFSNNIGVAKVAQKLGTKLYEHYTRLGFSKKINIFPGEAPGYITPPSKWTRASLISLSFGYEITANLVQIAQALSVIANEGKLINLHLIPTKVDPMATPLYSEKALNQLRSILQKTIDEGAAKKAAIKGYIVMGKTGTARLITNGRYDSQRHIFSFMAIVEKGSYKRVIVISIKEISHKGLLSSQVTVPLFERIAHKMLIHDKII